MIAFKCRSCHQVIEAPGSRAGQIEVCPTCRTPVEVPRPRADAAPVAASAVLRPSPAAPAATAGMPVPGTGGRDGGGLIWMIEVVGLLVTALGLLAVAMGILTAVTTSNEWGWAAGWAAAFSGIAYAAAGLALAGLGMAIGELRKIRSYLARLADGAR